MSVTTHPPHKPIPICTLLQDDDFCPVHHKGQCRRPEKTVHLPTFEDHDMNGDGDENGESQSESEEEDAVKKAPIEPPATFDDTAPPALTLVYTPGGTLPRLSRYLYQLIEIRIPSKHLSVKNKEIATRQLWGTDIYTDDSDVVAILMHSGRMVIRMNPPTNNIGVVATFRVLPGQSNYVSSTRFYCKSRPWVSPYTKCSLSVVKSEPMEDGVMWAKPKPAPLEAKTDAAESDKKRARSREIRLMRPTMGTITDPQRFMKSRRRFAADATLIFNTWNEPCFKYSLGLVGDRGMDENEWTSARLKKEVIYCENNHQNKRYELSREEDSDIHATAENGKKYDVYRWAEVMVPVNYQPVMDVEKVPSIQAITIPLTSTTTTTSAPSSASKKRKSPSSTPPPSVPLPPSSLKILESHVDWDTIEWGPTMVRIRGREYIITTIQFKPITNITTSK